MLPIEGNSILVTLRNHPLNQRKRYTLVLNKEYLLTYTNSQGNDITPMFPVKSSEMSRWVENFRREGRFIRFKAL